MIWFTSDWHLGHKNIAGPKVSKWPGGYRDFESVEKMDATILGSLNDYVKQDDILYFLGDAFLCNRHEFHKYRERIVCRIINGCAGNHDKHRGELSEVFTVLTDVMTLQYPPIVIFMSHYSHRVWPGSHRGVIHLYGHSHGNIPDHGRSMDVGVDVAYKMYGEYRPFSLDDIMAIMNKKEIAYVDHHKERK